MEPQPTIVITTEEPQPEIPEKAKPELPPKPATELKVPLPSFLKGLDAVHLLTDVTEDPNVAEASKLLMPDLAKLFTETLFKKLNSPSPASDSRPEKDKEEESEKSTDERPAFNITEIMKLATPLIPILASFLSSRNSDIPERDSDIPERGGGMGPTFHSRKSKDTSLLVQIIIGKFSFIVTRTSEDKYTVAFKQETIFHKKVVSAKGLYKLLKTVTRVLNKNVHFGLLSNGSTLETKIIEPMDMSKKTLMSHIRYFLCLI